MSLKPFEAPVESCIIPGPPEPFRDCLAHDLGLRLAFNARHQRELSRQLVGEAQGRGHRQAPTSVRLGRVVSGSGSRGLKAAVTISPSWGLGA